MRLGGSRDLAERVLRHPAFVVDPTEVRLHDRFADFWQATIRWLIANSGLSNDEQCQLILDWAIHEHTEGEQGDRPPFSWKGRGFQSVLRHSLDYQRQRERPWSSHIWKRHGWDWTPVDEPWLGWSFVELTSGEALFREGQAMRHCVAGYAAYCAAGRSAIVSVRFRDQRCLTVELAPATGQLHQVRGACNRFATADEQQVIQQWLTAVVWPRLRLQAT
ncbi:MAG: PcfJ domain-containing protein [Planctomycetia bacterium]|nr:PcfJ domain-containing protein [Planctomycetia bacterium]